ncbi:oxidoreductase [Variovorax gossypii]|uniref:Oxidoreductase n=1 Tax=Variovorax gossypii TaxID=1679495 RepID=A0A3S0JXV7_9BURK|nr:MULTISPECIES: aldo/keto reductase [Variovorax]MDR6522091.1 aryl-alcohol dehydrogenase-like predicted oxidoreductase [Variovorax paradoxus]RTQ35601.1 oxidoreductase [Variovorax gossypii]
MNATNASEFLLGGHLPVRRLGFGAMRLSTNGFRGPARDPEIGRSVLRRAIELGVNLIDTAEFYQSSDGKVRANDLIREALHPYPAGLVIATKVGAVFSSDGSYRHGTGADMRRLVEDNLQSLGLDHLDLVYLRIGEMAPPHGESLGERFEALAALREEGLIRNLGISNVDINHLSEARSIAPVAAVQNHFHVSKRDDLSLLDECTAAGIGFSPFFPLGGGANKTEESRLVRIATRHGASPAQIALAWLLAYSPVMLPIPGTGSIDHLEENVAAATIRLSEEDHAELA